MATKSLEYDVFISYAREDSDWVRENLYERLLQCRSPDGRRPRIFFDVGDEGIQIGQSFPNAIAHAIQRSAKIVPVYSRRYFSKEMCLFELEKASQLDPRGAAGKLNPILIADQGLPEIPFLVNHINYYSTASLDWFDRLCKALSLSRTAEKWALQFQEQPGDVFVNHTLPVVHVTLLGEGGRPGPPEAITLANPEGTLHGTITKTAQSGVAVFDDLSINEPSGHTWLVAQTPGSAPANSQPFAVHSVAQHPKPPPAPGYRELPVAGEVLFFERGEALAVVESDRATVWSLDAKPLSDRPLSLPQRLRVVRRSGSLIALGDWSGNIHLLANDGRQRTWSAPSREKGFLVPADIDMEGDLVYAAYWNGSVYRLSLDGPAERVALCSEGAQALAVAGGRLLVVDFAGLLRIYRDGRLVNCSQLDTTIWMLRTYPDGIIAVSDSRCHRVTTDGMPPLSFDLPMRSVASIDENTPCPTVIGADGKGFRLNVHLELTGFHTVPGAVAVSSDDVGVYSVLGHADGSRTLLVKERIVFTHPQGVMALSAQGDWLALGGAGTTRLLDAASFQRLIRKRGSDG